MSDGQTPRQFPSAKGMTTIIEALEQQLQKLNFVGNGALIARDFQGAERLYLEERMAEARLWVDSLKDHPEFAAQIGVDLQVYIELVGLYSELWEWAQALLAQRRLRQGNRAVVTAVERKLQQLIRARADALLSDSTRGAKNDQLRNDLEEVDTLEARREEELAAARARALKEAEKQSSRLSAVAARLKQLRTLIQLRDDEEVDEAALAELMQALTSELDAQGAAAPPTDAAPPPPVAKPKAPRRKTPRGSGDRPKLH